MLAAVAAAGSAPSPGATGPPKTDAQSRPATGGGGQSSASGTSASPVNYVFGVQRDERGISYSRVAATSADLNVCVWGDTRHGADITIPFNIDDFGPVDAGGFPAPGNALYGKQARMELVNYDIDDDAPISVPERDWVYFGNANAALESYDRPVGMLDGETDVGHTQAFSFPASYLRPKSAQNPSGLNELHFDVDTGNNGRPAAQWCAGINHVIIRIFDNEPLPALLIHGFTSTGSRMEAMKQLWIERYPALAGRLLNPDYDGLGGVLVRMPEVVEDAETLLLQSRRGKLNVVGHSFGGITARFFNYFNSDYVANVAMLGSPNGGDRLANAACIYLLLPHLRRVPKWAVVVQEAAKATAEQLLGECQPNNAIFQMTTFATQGWNAIAPDPGGPKYWALAGNDQSGALGWLASQILREPNDGLVTVRSALWLRPSAEPLDDEPSQPGNHTPIGVYPLKHAQLRTDPAPVYAVLCRLYPEACLPGDKPIQMRARGAAATRRAPSWSDAMNLGWPLRLEASARSARAGMQAVGSPELDTSHAEDVQIAPGTTATISLGYEGSPEAVVVVVSDRIDDLTATFEGTPLGRADWLDRMPVLALLQAPAADGTLRVTNTGSVTANVRVLKSIETNRRVSVAASPMTARPNTPVTFTVTVDGAVAGETPHVTIVNEADQIAHETDPAAAGGSTWTGTWTPPGPGTYSVRADIEANRPRSAVTEFTVASGAATIGQGFTEQLLDENQNGLYDTLVVRPTVNATVAGKYVLTGELRAGDGTTVSAASASVDLVVGSQTPTLRFSGRSIHASGRSGPYRLANVTVVRQDDALHREDTVADVGGTAAHAVGSFEHDRVLIDRGGFSSRGVDSNGDGRFEQVNVTTKVSVETAGSYSVSGELRAADGAFVAARLATVSLAAGANTFELAFFGTDIGRSGKAGPYTLAHLSVTSSASLTARDAVVDAHTTPPFAYTDFAGPDVTASASIGGGPVTLTIPSGTQHGRISFAGTGGQDVAVELSSSTLSGAAELRGPDNRVLAEASVGTGGGFLEPMRLAQDGTHTVVVDPSTSAGGSVTVRLHAVPADATASATVGGAAATVTTTVAGQNARVTFSGSSGQRISAKLTSSTITSGTFSLVRPDGVEHDSGLIDSAGGWLDVQTLPAAGTHTLVVDPAGAAVGAASVNVYNVPADVSGTTRYGRTETVTTTTPGQNAKLTFSGNANDKVTVSLTSTAITAGTLALQKPDGSTQASTSIGTSGAKLSGLVLATKGTYTIFVNPARWATGSASVTLTAAADVTGTITAGGAAVSKTTTVAGQNIRLTFNGSANQRVSVRTTTASGITAGSVSLLHPDGSTIGSASISSNAAFVDTQTLPAAGTYTILIDPSGDQIGSATTNLYNVVDTSGTIVPGGAAQTVTLNTPGQNGRLTFTGSANQRVSVSLTNSTLSAATVRLLRPDGTTQASTTIGTGGGSIPMQVLPVAGTYTILVDPTGVATGAVTVTLGQGPADVTGTITPGGAPVTVTITTAEQNARITFTGTSGQRVSLGLSNDTIGSGFSCTSAVSILRPDGTALASESCVQPAAPAFLDTRTLATAGTYTVFVDPSGSNTGSITLTLYDVPADVSGPIVPGGSPVTVTMATPGQNARLTFTGAAGQRVSLSLSNDTIGSGFNCTSSVSILRPDGTALASESCVQPAAPVFVDTRTLASAGTYTVVVDPSDGRTGSLTLTLHDVPADVTGPIVPGGLPVTVTMATPGQNARLTFTGAAGQRVSLSLSNDTIGSGFNCTSSVSILKPDGSTQASQSCVQPASLPFIDTQTLAAAGTYSVVVDPRDGSTGSITLTLHDVPADLSGPIVPGGSSVTATLSTPGQNARYTFDGAVGQRISMSLTNDTIGSGFNCTAAVSIVKPDGTDLTSQSCVQPASLPFFDTQTLSAAGTYTVVVDPRDGHSGSLTLTLYDVPADATGTVLVGGPGVSVMLSTPGQNARLTVDAPAGQQRTLTLSGVTIGTSSCCSARVSILNPDGTTLSSPSFFGTSGRVMTFTPTASGTHTIVLDPDGGSTGGVTTAVS